MEACIASLKTEGEDLRTGAAKGSRYAFGGRFEKADRKKQWLLWYMFLTIVRVVYKKLDYCLTCIYPNMYENTPTCRISDIGTLACRISQTKRMIIKCTSDPFHGSCKMDSHADTTGTSKNCVILKYTDCSCDVLPFFHQIHSDEGRVNCVGRNGIYIN